MPKNIILLEPYFTGSHKVWAEDYAAHSRHSVRILSMEGRYWKWRMHGGAVHLAHQFSHLDFKPDLIMATDMLDLSTFLALTRSTTADIPAALYFHENQITYPWSPADRDIKKARDHHYGFINYSAALAAEGVFFNSLYHRDSFFEELPRFLKHFPDHRNTESIETIRLKSGVLPVGLDLSKLERLRPEKNIRSRPAVILWNHRWEYDKNPEEFFNALAILTDQGLDFQVIILGENFKRKPGIFEKAKQQLGPRVIHFGYCPDFTSYARLLYEADILPVTSNQDFFGISILEAVYCGCTPLLPRRLTYPELFPEQEFPDLFYNDTDDLIAKLTAVINGKEPYAQQNLRKAVRRFDWKRMAPLYDGELEKIAEKGVGT
ncbi:MAG: DUF3524 domain-containing protein [Candidatus Aminicenantes bacterium]|nr:DUF3524 domain-containing protein [Candidatus Aminicenantes bacterium]